jgi:hypothetical protein
MSSPPSQDTIAPYSVYDIVTNAGGVNAGIDANAGCSAVESICR